MTSRRLCGGIFVAIPTAIPDVPFYVYLENPYTEEGDRRTDIFPLYSGKTAESGTIKATLAVPNTATTLYVYTPVSSFEMIQTCEIQNNMNITFTTTGVNAKSAKARAGGEGVFTGRRNAKVIEASTNLFTTFNSPMVPVEELSMMANQMIKK